MYSGGVRAAAVYTFTKTGSFVSQANLSPTVKNTTGIAFDGASAYVNQNDSPFLAYEADPEIGTVLDTFFSNPGHGQRLGFTYWSEGDLLIESYDDGISVLDPADGSELQFIANSELGYDSPLDQTFGAEISGGTLYLMTLTRVYTYAIDGDDDDDDGDDDDDDGDDDDDVAEDDDGEQVQLRSLGRAREFQVPCPADINSDSAVNSLDLIDLVYIVTLKQYKPRLCVKNVNMLWIR